ncbi:unnamed protein product [Rhizoctonia solani]|uniref:PNPLA domain-containing protein n=1 Tax=Rhizoctonia solani TaxID=456999 RepID=A0A8H3DT46_9AGAM|nr:unnamed protein product [Rhizoctonia solani]
MSTGLNILCIDGGGVRGLSSLIILDEIMLRIQNAKARGTVHPHEHFDLIAGTGTGGISACMLGRLQMPIKKVISEYAKLVKEVFGERKYTGSTLYKGTKLQEVLKAMIRDATGNEGEMMNDGRESSGCRTVVFAMAGHNLNAGLPVMFRSYTATTNPGPDCTIWEALHATMAHPDLFKSIEIVESGISQSFVGGELGCSNPLAHVLNEVGRVYPDRQVASVVSIGAGHARTIQVPGPSRWHRTQDVVVMKDMATDSERVAEEMMIRFRSRSGVYFRFNVDQGMQNMKDGSWERLGEAMQHTKAYLQKSETSQKLEEAARASIERRSVVQTTHAAGEIPGLLESLKPLAGFKRCPAPTKFYTGRQDETSQVIACITDGKHGLRVCVVYGLGGVGKTQLVLSVIERTWKQWDHIIYVDASSSESIEKGFKDFAAAQNVGQTRDDLIGWLESCGERWLVVFDNADDPSTHIQRYIPARGQGGSVIITTRLPDVAALAKGPSAVCHLSSMSQADGTALLVTIARSRNQSLVEDDLKAAEGLVNDFGCLALAIVHAGAYIAHSPAMTIAKYRSLLSSQRRRLLNEYKELPRMAKLDERGDTVYTTWRICYDQLKPESRELLWLIAYLHYDGIFEGIFERAAHNMHSKHLALPLADLESEAQSLVKQFLSNFFDSDGNWDTIKFARVAADLTSYSLMEFDRKNLTYRVHVLVHDWAKMVVPHTPELAAECTSTLLSLSIDWTEDAESLAFKRRLGLHVTSVLAQHPTIGAYCTSYFQYVYSSTGQWTQKARLMQSIVAAFERKLGNDDTNTWAMKAQLAESYAQLGQWNEAAQLQEKVADAYKRLEGDDDPQTFSAIGDLALYYCNSGRLDEAERLQLQVVNSQKNIQGLEHPDTLVTMGNLAMTYSHMGQYAKAEQLEVQVFNGRKRVLGEEHPHTLTSMNNLASTYSYLNRWDEAEELYHEAISISERVLGDQHPSTQKYRKYLQVMQSRKPVEL